MGIKACKPRKKPLPSKKHVKSRLAWAKNYETWTVVDWEKVLFSDETNIELIPDSGAQFVHRRSGEPLKKECIISTVKHGGESEILGLFR